MAILPIAIYGNNILRKKSDKIKKSELDDDIKLFIKNLKETAENVECVGLAAPQVGYSLPIFVMIDVQKMAKKIDNDKNNKERIFKICINPEIVESSKNYILSAEGCLSVPGVPVNVYRSCEIKIKYLNENFEKIEETLTGYESCVFQHEHDHLNGKLLIDHVKKSKISRYKDILKKLEEGKKIDVPYKII